MPFDWLEEQEEHEEDDEYDEERLFNEAESFEEFCSDMACNVCRYQGLSSQDDCEIEFNNDKGIPNKKKIKCPRYEKLNFKELLINGF